MSAAGQKQLKIPDGKPSYGDAYPPDFFPELTRTSLIEHLERAKEGETSSTECLALDMEGCEVWYHTTFVPVCDDEGRIEYVIVTSVNITERKQAEEALQSNERAIRELCIITSSIGTHFEDRVRSLLELGCERFNLPIGVITRKEDDQFKLMFVRDKEEGDSRFIEQSMKPICQTYCSFALQTDEPVCFEHAGKSAEWRAHPGYSNLGLEAFLGVKLVVAQEIYGMIYFMNSKPHQQLFTAGDKDFLMLMARWIGEELELNLGQQVLQESNERLRELNIQLSATEEAGRKHLARELHDQFGQTLTLLKFELSELADRVINDGLVPSGSSASDKFLSITALVDSAIQAVRNISSFLRPPILDDFGLIPALEWLVEDIQERTHVRCSVSIDPQLTHLSFSEAQTTTLFRISQELLTNVIRHANASEVKLGFKKESNWFILDVFDSRYPRAHARGP
jgi:signal transduction histidine kinase